MLAATETPASLAGHWLASFEAALAAGDEAALRELCHPEFHWRDVLALTWRIRTLSGRDRAGAPGAFRDRSGSHCAAPRHARRDEMHRGDLPLRDRNRPRQRRAEAAA